MGELLLRDLHQRQPNSLPVLEMLALSAVRNEDYPEAVAALQALLARLPEGDAARGDRPPAGASAAAGAVTARRRYACAGLRRARIERQIAVAFVGRVSEAPPGNMLGSGLISCRRRLSVFGSQPGKRFSRVTSAYSVLRFVVLHRFSVAQGASWNGNDCRTVLSPPEEGPGEEHCQEVFYVICGFSVFCAPG